MKKQYFLVISLLFLSIVALAQPNNLQLSQTLMEKFAKKEGKNYYKIKGDLKESSTFKKDSSSKYMLEIFPPNIEYQKVSKNTFLRKIEIRFIKSLGDSLISKTESISDTLSIKQIQQIRAKSPNPYKGGNPLPMARYLMPSASILGSVAVIVLLFYLRSS
jgi:hypothetical protein